MPRGCAPSCPTRSATGERRNTNASLRWNRDAIAAAIPVAAVAGIAGVVSYSHIVALGLRTHQGPADSHLLPIPIDGLIVAGSVILAAGSPLGWLGVALGVGGTLFANLQFGIPYGAAPGHRVHLARRRIHGGHVHARKMAEIAGWPGWPEWPG